MNSQPTFLVLTSFELNKMAILSKGCKPDNFESHNSLNLCLTNIQALSLNFIKCEFFLGSNSPSWHSCSIWDKLGWLSLFWQFFCNGSSFFNPKGFCYSHAWFWSLHEERTSFCMDLSLENSADPCLCFQLALPHSASCFFFLYSKGDAPVSLHSLWLFLRWLRWSLWSFNKDVPWEDIFELGATAADIEFCGWV